MQDEPRRRQKLADRLSLTLAPGQRDTLESIARLNGVSLAHVVRVALTNFIARNADKQLPLAFPTWPEQEMPVDADGRGGGGP